MAKKKKEKETIKEAEVTASEKEFNTLLMKMSVPQKDDKKHDKDMRYLESSK